METSYQLNPEIIPPPATAAGRIDASSLRFKDHVRARIIKDMLFKGTVILLAFLSLLPLLLILYYITKNGIAVIDWDFLTRLPHPTGEPGGGIFNAIIGTGMLIILSSILSIPFGISAGIYLSERGEGKIAHIVRLCVVVLQGTPSIVIGIIAYMWVVAPLGGFSAVSGGIALSIMMLPVIIKTTEETLKLMPWGARNFIVKDPDGNLVLFAGPGS